MGPRVAPLEPEAWSDEVRKALERWQPPMNFHKTMAHHPRTLREWIGFGEHILFDNLLAPREREIVILRVAANLRCDYEWGAHKRYTLAENLMTAEEIARLAEPLIRNEWTDHEAALIAATDDLQRDGAIGDEAWNILSRTYSPAHFIDLIYLVGEFIMVGMFMKSFRIERDQGLEPLPRSCTSPLSRPPAD